MDHDESEYQQLDPHEKRNEEKLFLFFLLKWLIFYLSLHGFMLPLLLNVTKGYPLYQHMHAGVFYILLLYKGLKENWKNIAHFIFLGMSFVAMNLMLIFLELVLKGVSWSLFSSALIELSSLTFYVFLYQRFKYEYEIRFQSFSFYLIAFLMTMVFFGIFISRYRDGYYEGKTSFQLASLKTQNYYQQLFDHDKGKTIQQKAGSPSEFCLSYSWSFAFDRKSPSKNQVDSFLLGTKQTYQPQYVLSLNDHGPIRINNQFDRSLHFALFLLKKDQEKKNFNFTFQQVLVLEKGKELLMTKEILRHHPLALLCSWSLNDGRVPALMILNQSPTSKEHDYQGHYLIKDKKITFSPFSDSSKDSL